MSTAMTTTRGTSSNYLQRSPSPSGLAEVLDLILDKGLVIDLYVRVSLVGIELLVIDARIVVASVDTYLRFAEAVNRLDIAASDDSEGLPELMDDLREGGAKKKTKGALEGAKDTVSDLFGGDDDEEEEDDDEAEDEQEERPRRRRTSSSRRKSSNGSDGRRSRRRAPARSRD
jgi:gas vesicle structural protein